MAKRPRVKLGFIEEAIAQNGELKAFRILIERAPGEFYKKSRVYAAEKSTRPVIISPS